MIIVRLIGGLGNQMFQYAAGRSLALHHNTELKLDITQFEKNKHITPRQYDLSHFTIKEAFATDGDLHRVNGPTLSRLKKWDVGLYCTLTGKAPVSSQKELHYHFNSGFFALPDNVYLEGYWQSEKYFKNIEDIIRQEFTLREKPDVSDERMAEEILQSNAVSVHVRRGDYVANPDNFSYHGVCSLEYYSEAIKIITKFSPHPVFYIFSDDPSWVQRNLMIDYPHIYVTHNPKIHDYADLWLMSLCKHHIIANSSFSWWGAWLGNHPNKIIIAPKRWFNKANVDTRDLIPNSWYML